MSDLRDRGTLRGTLSVGSESGGTDNYNNLINKPYINSHELVGDQSGDDLGLINSDDLTFNVGYVSNNLHNIKYKNRTFTAYADPFRGATADSNGTMGLVRAPLASQGDYNKFLKGNGTWAAINVENKVVKLNNNSITATGNYVLNESIENYDFLWVVTLYIGEGGNSIVGTTIVPVEYIKRNYGINAGVWIDGGNNDRSSQFTFYSDTNITVGKASLTDEIYAIYGIKFGGNMTMG